MHRQFRSRSAALDAKTRELEGRLEHRSQLLADGLHSPVSVPPKHFGRSGLTPQQHRWVQEQRQQQAYEERSARLQRMLSWHRRVREQRLRRYHPSNQLSSRQWGLRDHTRAKQEADQAAQYRRNRRHRQQARVKRELHRVATKDTHPGGSYPGGMSMAISSQLSYPDPAQFAPTRFRPTLQERLLREARTRQAEVKQAPLSTSSSTTARAGVDARGASLGLNVGASDTDGARIGSKLGGDSGFGDSCFGDAGVSSNLASDSGVGNSGVSRQLGSDSGVGLGIGIGSGAFSVEQIGESAAPGHINTRADDWENDRSQRSLGQLHE